MDAAMDASFPVPRSGASFDRTGVLSPGRLRGCSRAAANLTKKGGGEFPWKQIDRLNIRSAHLGEQEEYAGTMQ